MKFNLNKLVPEYVPNAIGGVAGWVGGLGLLAVSSFRH
jgi:hypothetical protein